MTQTTTHSGRTARRLTILVASLLVATTGTATAHGSGSYGGGMMGGGWGLSGGAMGLWGLLWMGLLLAIPLYLIYTRGGRRDDETDDRPVEVLRERYARGDISESEFDRQREALERTR